MVPFSNFDPLPGNMDGAGLLMQWEMNKLPRVFRSLTKWHAARPWSVTNIEPSTVNLPRSHGSLLWTTPQFHARKHWEKKKQTSSLLNFIRVYSTHKVAFFIFFRPKSKDLVLCQLEHGRTEVFQILLTGDRIPVTGKVSVICCWNPSLPGIWENINILIGRKICKRPCSNLIFSCPKSPLCCWKSHVCIFFNLKSFSDDPPSPIFPAQKGPMFQVLLRGFQQGFMEPSPALALAASRRAWPCVRGLWRWLFKWDELTKIWEYWANNTGNKIFRAKMIMMKRLSNNHDHDHEWVYTNYNHHPMIKTNNNDNIYIYTNK